MQRLLIAASAVAVAGFMAPPARPTSVRMDASVDSILEDIKGLTLVEASELVSKIEETFGVDASSAPVAMAVAGGAAAGGGEEAADEKDEFDVVLTEVPADKKIAVLKIVRTITGLGLKVWDRRLFSTSAPFSPFLYNAGGQGHGRVGAGDDQGGRAQGRGRGHPEADRGGRRQGRAQVGRFAFSRLTYVPLSSTTPRRWRRPAIEYITLHVLLGRAEGLEGDADALAELFVGGRGAIEDNRRISPGSAAYFEAWPVPCFKAEAQTRWRGYY